MPIKSKVGAIMVMYSKVERAAGQPDPQRAMEILNYSILRDQKNGQLVVVLLNQRNQGLMIKNLSTVALTESHNG